LVLEILLSSSFFIHLLVLDVFQEQQTNPEKLPIKTITTQKKKSNTTTIIATTQENTATIWQ